MSIIIKNLDVPVGCQKCKFFRKHMFGNGLDYSYSCVLGAKDFPFPWIKQMDNRASDCPIEEPKTGHWVDGKCNRCGTHAPFWAMASAYYLSEYCPHCGAKMAESEDK